MIYGLTASVALVLFVVSILSMATVIFAPFLAGAFVLAVAGAIGDADDKHVDQRAPQVHPTRWREGA